MLYEAREKLNHAEETATQAKNTADVVITQDQKSVTDDQMKEAEKAVESAQKAVDEVRQYLNSKLPEVREPSPPVSPVLFSPKANWLDKGTPPSARNDHESPYSIVPNRKEFPVAM